MLPGVGAALKNVDLDDKHFQRLEAMIKSMTVRERRFPQLIDLPRRRRIAQGSGNPLDAVHGLIKQFKGMQDMMKKLGIGRFDFMDRSEYESSQYADKKDKKKRGSK